MNQMEEGDKTLFLSQFLSFLNLSIHTLIDVPVDCNHPNGLAW